MRRPVRSASPESREAGPSRLRHSSKKKARPGIASLERELDSLRAQISEARIEVGHAHARVAALCAQEKKLEDRLERLL